MGSSSDTITQWLPLSHSLLSPLPNQMKLQDNTHPQEHMNPHSPSWVEIWVSPPQQADLSLAASSASV